ncbi:hypothetical protein Hanom_Chr14g01316911 [Helianthus anomalus]
MMTTFMNVTNVNLFIVGGLKMNSMWRCRRSIVLRNCGFCTTTRFSEKITPNSRDQQQ